MTRIVIDGRGEDWGGIPALVASDPPGDALPSSADLAMVQALRDDEALYLLLSFHAEGYLDHIIFFVGGILLMFTVDEVAGRDARAKVEAEYQAQLHDFKGKRT